MRITIRQMEDIEASIEKLIECYADDRSRFWELRELKKEVGTVLSTARFLGKQEIRITVYENESL